MFFLVSEVFLLIFAIIVVQYHLDYFHGVVPHFLDLPLRTLYALSPLVFSFLDRPAAQLELIFLEIVVQIGQHFATDCRKILVNFWLFERGKHLGQSSDALSRKCVFMHKRFGLVDELQGLALHFLFENVDLLAKLLDEFQFFHDI